MDHKDVDVYAQNFINGKFYEANQYLDSYDPSVGKVWARIPDSDAEDVMAAVTAAKNAYNSWSETTVQERSKILLRIADLLETNLDQFAVVESRDQGKPVWLSQTVDVPRAVYNFRFFATSILHHVEHSTYQDHAKALHYTYRMPIGVCALISPWNLPLYLLTFKIAPAIACGNTVVCKPSEMTSVTAWMLCNVFQEAGLPAGVVNMVFGTGFKVGDALVRNPDIAAVSFTGSTATACKIRGACISCCKKLSLELGGKNAAIIFDDADMEKCILTTIRSSFINQGEVCLCTSRIFVQRGIYQDFLQKFVNAARNIKIGDPRTKGTWMGALVSAEHMAKVKSYIQIAEDEGGQICHGGNWDANEMNLPPENARGYFVPPTIITDLKDNSKCMQEEIFGPVVCVTPFDSEKEVIERANNVQYGLSATVWSNNVNTVHRVSQKLRAGIIWSNCWLVRDLHMPFGGMKESGSGREGAEDSMDFYTEVKSVCVQIQ